MTRFLVLALVVATSSTFLLGCPDDKASPDNKAAAATAPSGAAPAAASAKPAAKGGW